MGAKEVKAGGMKAGACLGESSSIGRRLERIGILNAEIDIIQDRIGILQHEVTMSQASLIDHVMTVWEPDNITGK